MNHRGADVRSPSPALSAIRAFAPVLAFLCTASGLAQASSGDVVSDLDEIVVTATRQPQTLDKVPISIAAYTQKTLTDLNVLTIDDLTRVTPGVTLSRNPFGNGDQSLISIRGIASSVGAATTGVYIDDTPVQVRNVGVTATNPYPAVFDLERVEVLRGPQGTLFGAGAEGGAVRFITPTPSLTKDSLYARSELSTIDNGGTNYEEGVAVGGPIVDNQLGFRLSAWYRHDGGYINRIDYFTGDVTSPNSNYKDSSVIHGSLLWEPIANLSITTSLYYQDTDLNDSNVYWEEFSSGNQFQSAALGPQPSIDHFYLPSVKVEWGGDYVHVISNSSYFSRNNHGVNDFTTADNTNLGGGIAPAFSYYPLPGETQAGGHYVDLQTSYTQELRFEAPDPDARINWVAGVFYHHETLTSDEFVGDPNTNIIATYGYGVPTSAESLIGPLLPGNGVFQSSETDTDKQLAGFAQADFGLTSNLKLSLGARVSHVEYDYNSTAAGPLAGGPSSGSEAETPVTPHYGLSYQADSHNLYYFSASKGFRPGGGNSPIPLPLCGPSLALFGLKDVPPTYSSDSDWSYEVGAKNQILDGRLQSEVSAYHIDWRNIETAISLNCGFSVNLNLGQAVSNGFDLAERFRVTDALTLGLALGYDDAHYTQSIQTGVQPSGAAALAIGAGDPLGQAPWTGNLTGDYRFTVLQKWKSFLHADFQYSSHDNTPLDKDVANYDPNLPRTPAIVNLNARVGVDLNGLECALFATNILGEQPEIEREHDSPTDPLYRGMTIRPRTIGVQVNLRY
jgi:iron complex outermembrane recepter protein